MFSTFLLGVIYMAIISVLVRPDSRASEIIAGVTNSLANLTYAAIKGEAK